MADIEGKAAVIAWPLNRITSLDNYPDVFQNVPAHPASMAGQVGTDHV